MESLLTSRSTRSSFPAVASTRGASPRPSRVATLAGARSRPLRAGPKDSILEVLAQDDMLNAKELVQWESGLSFNDIAARQGIRIRRHCHPTASLKEIEKELGAPLNILEKIIWDKEIEVAEGHAKKPLEKVIKAARKAPPSRDFYGALEAAYKHNGVPALIAEVKKASPSRGVLREDFNPVEIAQAYEKNGAACLSILTDEKYFQGSFENLEKVRTSGVKCPLLCKEFVIDKWQIYNARSKGADAILLIAAVLPDLDIRKFLQICEELGMTALIEVHDEREMERVLNINGVKLTGINNRSLETFVVDTTNTKMLLEKHGDSIREKGILVVGESGLFTPEDVAYVQNAGQVCNATSWLLLNEKIAKQFLDRLVGWAKNMKVSDPVEDGCRLGSVVSEEQYEKIKKFISAARSEGATILHGDGRPQHLRRGLLLAPTIITDVSTSMQIGQEEVFGPVIRVKEFKTESEDVELAHDTHFGLADAVIFHDQERCDGMDVLHLQWDPGGINAMYRLEGKPIFKKGGMLGM